MHYKITPDFTRYLIPMDEDEENALTLSVEKMPSIHEGIYAWKETSEILCGIREYRTAVNRHIPHSVGEVSFETQSEAHCFALRHAASKLPLYSDAYRLYILGSLADCYELILAGIYCKDQLPSGVTSSRRLEMFMTKRYRVSRAVLSKATALACKLSVVSYRNRQMFDAILSRKDAYFAKRLCDLNEKPIDEWLKEAGELLKSNVSDTGNHRKPLSHVLTGMERVLKGGRRSLNSMGITDLDMMIRSMCRKITLMRKSHETMAAPREGLSGAGQPAEPGA